MEVLSSEEKKDIVYKHDIYARGGIKEFCILFAPDGKREVRVCTLDSRDSEKYTDRTSEPREVIHHSLLGAYNLKNIFSWVQRTWHIVRILLTASSPRI